MNYTWITAVSFRIQHIKTDMKIEPNIRSSSCIEQLKFLLFVLNVCVCYFSFDHVPILSSVFSQRRIISILYKGIFRSLS